MITTFTHALGWSLVHSLWQGLIIALLLGLTLLTVREKSSVLKYHLSVAAMALVFVSWLATFTILWGYGSTDGASAPLLTAAGVSSQTPLLLKDHINTWMPFLVNAWMLGFVVLSFKLVGGVYYAKRLTTHKVKEVPPYWQIRLKRLQNRLAISKPIKMLESALVQTPMVVGHLKPVILVPLGALTRLPAREVEGVLLHELGHIMRNDYLVNLLQSMMDTLFFHHPAIWWISNKIRTEREHCCDDIAIAASGDPRTFATALYHLQEVQMKTPQMAMAALGAKGYLYHRIKRVLGANPPAGAMEKTAGSALLLICLLSVTLFAGAANLNQNTSLSGKSDGQSEQISYWEDGGRVILDLKDNEVTGLTIDGQVIPQSQWSNHQGLIESGLTAKAEAEAMEAELREQEAQMRQQEAQFLEQEKAFLKQEEAFRRQEEEAIMAEAQIREQEAVIREQEAVLREEEVRLREQAEIMARVEASFQEEEAVIREEARRAAEEAREEAEVLAREAGVEAREAAERAREAELEQSREAREKAREEALRARESRRDSDEARQLAREVRERAREESLRSRELSQTHAREARERAREEARRSSEDTVRRLETTFREEVRELEAHVANLVERAQKGEAVDAELKATQRALEVKEKKLEKQLKRQKIHDEKVIKKEKVKIKNKEKKKLKNKDKKKLKNKEKKKLKDKQKPQEENENL